MEKKINKNNLVMVLGWIMAVLMLGPIYIMFINSFKGREQIFTDTLGLPKGLDLSYYIKAMEKMNFFSAFCNSLIITILSVVFIVICSSMAAWVLVRTKSKISDAIFYMFVVTMLVPFQSVMIPLIQYMSKWDLGSFSMLNTRHGLIFMHVGFGISLSLFLYHGFIKSIPKELEEAACIDGCNKLQVFCKIIFPSLKPITMTVAILNVISIWNDYLLPSLVLKDPELRTIPLSTFYFFGEFTIQWNLAMAGLVLSIIPVIIFYLIAQKHIIKGVMSGAVK